MSQQVQENQAIITDMLDGHFHVIFRYEKTLVDYIRALPSRQWFHEYKYWKLPNEFMDQVVSELNKRGYSIVNRDMKPVVHIREKQGGDSEVSCRYDPTIYQIIHNVPDIKWNPINDSFVIPITEINNFIEDLNEQEVAYDYTKVIPETPQTKKTISPKQFKPNKDIKKSFQHTH